jgi:hypothetical protein
VFDGGSCLSGAPVIESGLKVLNDVGRCRPIVAKISFDEGGGT